MRKIITAVRGRRVLMGNVDLVVNITYASNQIFG